MIDVLTTDQEEIFQRLCELWRARVLTTEPADRPRAEAAVDQLYLSVGLTPPCAKLWLPSPFAGAIGATLMHLALPPVTYRSLPRIFGPIVNRVEEQLRILVTRPLSSRLWHVTSILHEYDMNLGEYDCPYETELQPAGGISGMAVASVWNLVKQSVDPTLHTDIEASIDDSFWHLVERNSRPAFNKSEHGYGGLLDVSSLFNLSFWEEIELLECCPSVHAAITIGDCCRQWWPFPTLAILVERPAILCMDEHGEMHNGDGPAVVYRDGWSVWAWRGSVVERHVVENPATITLTEIDKCFDLRLQEVHIERFGLGRLMMEGKGRIVHSDESGILYKKQMNTNVDPIMAVKVRNSTPEPDGTFQHHFLRVPPNMKRARQAVAWTFGLREDQYQIQVQT